MFTAFAQIMHALAVEHERAAVFVQFDFLALEEGHQGTHQIERVGRAAGDIDGLDAQVAKSVVDALGRRGIGLGGLHAAVAGAGAHAYHGLGLGQNALTDAVHGLAADVAVFALHGCGDGPFHDADKAFGGGDGLVQGLFRGFAGGGHDGFMVIQGNGIHDQAVDERFISAQQGFGTARAFSGVQIHDRRTTACQSRGHVRGEGRAHAHGHRHRRTEFHEIAAADALAF